jgi:hypothetical protein
VTVRQHEVIGEPGIIRLLTYMVLSLSFRQPRETAWCRPAKIGDRRVAVRPSHDAHWCNELFVTVRRASAATTASAYPPPHDCHLPAIPARRYRSTAHHSR